MTYLKSREVHKWLNISFEELEKKKVQAKNEVVKVQNKSRSLLCGERTKCCLIKRDFAGSHLLP